MKYALFAVIIVAITISILLAGRLINTPNMDWYHTLTKPAITPPSWVFSVVWISVYCCAALSAILVWRQPARIARFWWAVGLFILNAVMNVSWSYVYFGLRLQEWAVWHAAILCIETLILAIVIWPLSHTASWLLAPYVGWTAFATYLAWQLLLLNG